MNKTEISRCTDAVGDPLEHVEKKDVKPTVISAVIDRSGSMASMWSETRLGYASFLESLKEQGGDAVYSLQVFDDVYQTVYSHVNAAQATTIPENIRPRGSTALNDAIGFEISRIKKFQTENPRFTHVVLLIMTDGQENASREYTNTDTIKALVESCKAAGWQIIFMGANIDAFRTAARFGITGNIQYDRSTVSKSYLQSSRTAREYRSKGQASTFNVDARKT